MKRTIAVLSIASVAGMAAAGSVAAQTSAETVYQSTLGAGTPAAAPSIPAGAAVAGTPSDPGSSPVVGTAAAQATAPSGGTLPVTGFDALLILGAAAAAGGVGVALRRSARTND